MPLEAIAALAEAADKDIELHEKLDESARKIILYKRKFGLIPQFQLLESNKNLFMNHSKMALKYAYEALGKIGDSTLLPIKENIVFAGFAFVDEDREFRSASRFFTMMAQATENDCDFGYINTNIGSDEIDEMKLGIKNAEIILFTLFYRGLPKDELAEKMDRINEIMDELSHGKKRIILLCGNPFIIDYLNADLFVLTFSDSFSSLAASVVLLSGRENSLDY